MPEFSANRRILVENTAYVEKRINIVCHQVIVSIWIVDGCIFNRDGANRGRAEYL